MVFTVLQDSSFLNIKGLPFCFSPVRHVIHNGQPHALLFTVYHRYIPQDIVKKTPLKQTSPETSLKNHNKVTMAESSQPQTQIPRIFTPIDVTELDLEDRNCPICKQPMEERSEQPIRLPCTHVFGKRCITQWLLGNDSCPQCRRITLPEPQAQPLPPARRAQHNARRPAYLSLLPHHQRWFLVEDWHESRSALLYCLRANRFTPVTRALRFIEEQTSVDNLPGLWTLQYCLAIVKTPQMLIDGQLTALLASDEILVRKYEQELKDKGAVKKEEAEEQSIDFNHIASVLRERYIED